MSYNVSTQVSVQVARSESEASGTGAQNVIGLSNGPADSSINANALTGSSNSLRTLVRGQDIGTWNYNTLGTNSLNTAAHEFTHLLGVGDKNSAVLSNTDPDVEPSRATSADFRWGIQEATKRVDSTLHPGAIPRFFGGTAPSSFSNRVNVGAPKLGWWK